MSSHGTENGVIAVRLHEVRVRIFGGVQLKAWDTAVQDPDANEIEFDPAAAIDPAVTVNDGDRFNPPGGGLMLADSSTNIDMKRDASLKLRDPEGIGRLNKAARDAGKRED
ncbi:uncharacterized protein G6M90_00g004660 [Metarhizium brunneum]|uniref:Uncharacterized protein n=1 Tax=Metarhizium brunneum TaxID=500148 RepID=A0A7D5UTF8_9HYPO|nr:hypothetical protein G6M90_00g004660 [Metarhizium brunneum]